LIFLDCKGGNKDFLTDEPPESPETTKDKKSPGLSQGFDHLWNAQDIDHSFEVIGQKREAHLGAGFWYSFHQEITLIHTPLDCSEGMLNDSLAPGKEMGIVFNPSLHLIQQVFIHPAGYSSAALAGGALTLDLAVLA
jgi:hypothetical protein